MKLKVLKEHFVNFLPEDIDKKQKYLDEVWDLMEASYAKIGGPLKHKEEIVGKNYFWKLVRRNNKIVAAGIYKMNDREGRKLVLGGSDGSPQGKKDYLDIIRTNLQLDRPNNQHAWAEVSEAMEHIIVDKWGVTPIPNDIAEKVLKNIGKKIDGKNPDGYHYTRIIKGKPIEKVLVGYPPESLTKDSEDIEII